MLKIFGTFLFFPGLLVYMYTLLLHEIYLHGGWLSAIIFCVKGRPANACDLYAIAVVNKRCMIKNWLRKILSVCLLVDKDTLQIYH